MRKDFFETSLATTTHDRLCDGEIVSIKFDTTSKFRSFVTFLYAVKKLHDRAVSAYDDLHQIQKVSIKTSSTHSNQEIVGTFFYYYRPKELGVEVIFDEATQTWIEVSSVQED